MHLERTAQGRQFVFCVYQAAHLLRRTCNCLQILVVMISCIISHCFISSQFRLCLFFQLCAHRPQDQDRIKQGQSKEQVMMCTLLPRQFILQQDTIIKFRRKGMEVIKCGQIFSEDQYSCNIQQITWEILSSKIYGSFYKGNKTWIMIWLHVNDLY